MNVFRQEKGVDFIKIHANQPDKYVLALCDSFFEDSELAELAECCYKSTKGSKMPPVDSKGLHFQKVHLHVCQFICTTMVCRLLVQITGK